MAAINFDDRKNEELPEVEQIELFVLDGKTYTIPAHITGNKLLGFMQEMRVHGQESAAVGLLIDCIGRVGYQKLLEYQGLQPKDLKAIFDVVSRVAMGAMEEVTGN